MLYLFGAKKMQTSAKKACFQFAECSCRVSGGNFTLPSLGTVLDSLPSHGSSHLTLLFISLIFFINLDVDRVQIPSPSVKTHFCCALHTPQASHTLYQTSYPWRSACTYASPIGSVAH